MPHISPADLPQPSSFRHHITAHLRFNDIDILGHLNNTVYFSLYDTGKALYLAAVKGGTMDWQHVEFVIVNIDCAFIHSCFFGENLEIYTKLEVIEDKSLTLFQELVNVDTGEIKSVCRTVMVAVDAEKRTTVHVSQAWRDAFKAYEAHRTPIIKEQDGHHIMYFEDLGWDMKDQINKHDPQTVQQQQTTGTNNVDNK